MFLLPPNSKKRYLLGLMTMIVMSVLIVYVWSQVGNTSLYGAPQSCTRIDYNFHNEINNKI